MSSLTAAKSSAAARRAKYRAQYAYRDQLPFLAKNPRAGTSFWNVAADRRLCSGATRLAENSRLHSGAYAAARRCAASSSDRSCFEIIEARRPRTTKKPEGLSGIEIGFIRAIGEIVDLATMVPVIVAHRRQAHHHGQSKDVELGGSAPPRRSRARFWKSNPRLIAGRRRPFPTDRSDGAVRPSGSLEVK